MLFRCSIYGAIHLESLWKLDTDSFLLALERFLTFHSKPHLFVSDKGSNFVRADKELRNIAKATLTKDKDTDVIDMSNVEKKYSIKFQFSPANTPHYNGLIERIVQSTKQALKTVMGNSRPNDESFNTFLYKVTNYLNSFPITYIKRSDTDHSYIPLTPNHFLIGKLYSDIAPPFLPSDKFIARYAKVNKLLDQFWQRLINELTPRLQTYPKWNKLRREVAEGDIGVLLEDNLRNKYPLVRIEKAIKSHDGITRRITVSDGKKSWERNITHFVPLIENDGPKEINGNPNQVAKVVASL